MYIFLKSDIFQMELKRKQGPKTNKQAIFLKKTFETRRTFSYKPIQSNPSKVTWD